MNCPEDLDKELGLFWESQRTVAIADEKSDAKWGEKTELPPPTADEATVRLFAEPLIRGTIELREELDERIKKYAKNWD